MADNGDTLATRTRGSAGDTFTGGTISPDWIEIRNFTPSPMNVGGLYLTDDPDTPAKWQIPAGTTIPASGYLVVFASGLDVADPALDERGYLHANFSPQNGGEYLALVGGMVQAGFGLTITAPAGTRYYTTDGTDPRLPGGAIGPRAIAVTGDVTLAESGTIRSRVLSGGTWSALTEAFFTVASPLRDKAGGLIQSFAYDDDWYKETDGDGFSLVIVDPSASYDNPVNWRSSARLGGSPGASDAAPLAGDFNGDGQVDRLDAALLAQNFGRATGAHRGRGDMNGDGATNLADLAVLQASLGTAAPSPASSRAAGAIVVRSRRIDPDSVATTRRRDAALKALDSRSAWSPGDAGPRLTATRRSVAGRTRLVARAVDSLIDLAAR